MFLETRTLKKIFAGHENSKANITSPVISASHFLQVSYIPRLFKSLNIDSFAQKTKNPNSSNFCNYTLLSMPMLYFHILFKKYTHWRGRSVAMHLKCQATKTTLFLSFLGFLLPSIPPCSNITKILFKHVSTFETWRVSLKWHAGKGKKTYTKWLTRESASCQNVCVNWKQFCNLL